MVKAYLEITYRQGKTFAAYLHLERRAGDKSSRTERHGSWLVDFTSGGRVMGVEFTRPGAVDVDELNRILMAAHQSAVASADLEPLQGA